MNGDAFQQHGSRLQGGFNAQFTRRHRLGAAQGVLVAGGNFHENQSYFESRVTPLAPIVSRIHATPGFPLTVVAGVTFRLRGK